MEIGSGMLICDVNFLKSLLFLGIEWFYLDIEGNFSFYVKMLKWEV